MVSTLTAIGIGLMLAALLAVAAESKSGAGSALLTFGAAPADRETDEPRGADD